MVDQAHSVYSALPAFAPVDRWCQISGMGKTSTYKAATAGNLRIVKLGKRSLVDVQAGLAWLRSLPTADIKIAPRKTAA